MESTVEIELDISDNLRSKGFHLFREDKTIVLQDSDGNHVRSYIYEDWNKTIRQFGKKLENSQMILDPLIYQEVFTNSLALMATVIVLSAALATTGLSTIAATYADGGGGNGGEECDSTGVPPFKDLPDAAGATGNPHTCQQPTGDPHLDEDNPDTGNPHNT